MHENDTIKTFHKIKDNTNYCGLTTAGKIKYYQKYKSTDPTYHIEIHTSTHTNIYIYIYIYIYTYIVCVFYIYAHIYWS